jgi:hypothetical protein
MSLGSSCSVVDKINYYCVPGLQLDGVKQYINSENIWWNLVEKDKITQEASFSSSKKKNHQTRRVPLRS